MEPRTRRSAWVEIFAASVLGLFLELALVRWVSSEVRVFAYCKNLVLVACFLGFGVGCLAARRRTPWRGALFALLVLTMLVRLPWASLAEYGPRHLTSVLAELSGFMIFRADEPDVLWGTVARLAFAVGWTAVLFFLVAFVMLPFGQLVARGLGRIGRPLTGYSINVAGSLAGILAFTLATGAELPPLCWFSPAALGAAWLARRPSDRRVLVGIALALTLVLLPNDTPQYQELWSFYQKLGLDQGRNIWVNGAGYQSMVPQLPFADGVPAAVNRWNMPYVLHQPPGRVLLVGAGSGNDAAAALLAGASAVTAVEIDRTIYRIGRQLHPQRPYSDARVRVVVDDARHFLRSTRESYDVVVFSHLDSHTVLSSHTSIRLDNYIYTVEAFREARARLAPGGLLYVSFFVELPFIGDRLARNMTEAFGREPIGIEGRADERFREIHLVMAPPAEEAAIRARAATWPGHRLARYDTRAVVPSTDAWPFLPLDRPRVPPVMLAISAAILLLSVAFALVGRPRGEPFDGRMFWLGAAFMLVEVHDVSRLALVFGTTWQVNAWVIGVILGLILLANAAQPWVGRRSWGARAAIAGLFASLAAAYLVPLTALQAAAGPFGALAAVVLLCLPVFFAGIAFAEALAKSPSPGFALGWNALGAVLGGMAENASYVWGVPALALVAAAFYAAAFLWPRPRVAR